MLRDNLLFGGKAYKRSDEDKVELEQELKVLTPIKKQRGQYELSAEDQKYSNAVSRIRQPIEALFSWLNKVTGIENHQTSVLQKGYLPIFMGDSCNDDASYLSCTWLLIRVYTLYIPRGEISKTNRPWIRAIKLSFR